MISLYVANTTDKYDITNLLESVTWSGDYKQACRKLEFSIASSSFDKNIPKVPIKNGNMVLFYENGKELFRGFIYNFGKNSSNNNIDYTVYDYGFKFNDLKISYNVKGKTASEMFEKVLSDYKLIKGDIVNVNTKVTKVFIGTTAYDMIMTMYSQSSKVDGNKYMIITNQGKFSSIKKGTVKLQVAFEEGKNLIDSSYSASIEKVINRVLIVDEFGNVKSEVKNESDIKLFGLFQDIIKIEEGKDSTTEAKSMLQSEEQTCSLEGYGDSTCITGYGVTVKDNYTGLVGLFYIDSDTHKWEKGDYTISLGLNFKNIMNEVEVGEDENKDSGTKVTGGREVDAIFTAYAPTGNRTANGEKTNPSSLTCAVPKSVAFNTKIQIKGTNTDRDGLVYRSNDTGGKIVIDSKGYYHIDLLMATEAECIKFGKRTGKAIIGVEVLNYGSDVTSNEKAQTAVRIANTKVGSPHQYIWGAVGPNNFDCSGLTQFVYKQAGISIPRTSQAQSTFGKAISKDNLQVGDLLFFSTNGTGNVSHVGIYEGDGVFIHASSPKNGIKKNKITESYYVKAFKGARRVV
jgi:cell wall-associated NlpC family hydrolase